MVNLKDDSIVEALVDRYFLLATNIKNNLSHHHVYMLVDAAHENVPMNLEIMLLENDEVLIKEIDSIIENFCPHSGSYKNGFLPLHAHECGQHCTHGDS